MRTYICGSLLILFLCGSAFADNPIQKVEVAPLTGGISFNTVTTLYKSWITAPTVEMIGRKEIRIINNSTTNNLYLTGVSNSTAIGIVGPKEEANFKAASSLHIYASGDTVTFQVWEIR